MSTRSFQIASLLALGFITQPPLTAQAQIPFEHLSEKVLRESNPFSFIEFNRDVELSAEDFTIEGKSAAWIPGSLQWIRVGNGKDEPGILVPRARFRYQNGENSKETIKETEVALTQVDNPIKIKFKPRAGLKKHFYIDPSCSSFNLHLNEAKLSHSWVMISCHRVNNESDRGTKPVVLATVLWESESQGTLTQINLDSNHPKQLISNGGADSFEIEASVVPIFHHLGLSAGIGPYSSRNEKSPSPQFTHLTFLMTH